MAISRRVALAGLLVLLLGCASAAQRWEPAVSAERTPASRTFQYVQTGSDPIEINYERVGSGDRSLLFLHGFASSMRNWDDLRKHLDLEDVELLFLDLKGFGLSARPRDDDYWVRSQARIVRAFLETQGVESAVLVGHSYGGAVALMTAALFDDDLVEALVLIDGAAYKKYMPLFIDLLRTPVLGRLITWLLPRRLQLKMMLKKAFYDNRTLTPEILERYARFYRLPGSRYSLRKVARQAVPEDYAALQRIYPQIEVPTYLVWGRRDRLLRARNTFEDLKKDLPVVRFEIIEDCGHIPQEEAPAATAEFLSEIFAEARPPDP